MSGFLIDPLGVPPSSDSPDGGFLVPKEWSDQLLWSVEHPEEYHDYMMRKYAKRYIPWRLWNYFRGRKMEEPWRAK